MPMKDPAYWFGYHQAQASLFQGKTWKEAKADLQRMWEEQHPDMLWDENVDMVNEGWLAGREN